MSPEQAALESSNVDTRSDIYSLGVLLYELLTGSTPIERRQAKEAARVRDMLRDTDPPKPSERLSSSGELSSGISQLRQIEVGRLSQILRGDLDWIVMKAIDRDREARYKSADGFAQDVRNFLAGDPVSARPPTLRYRIKKFVGKHRGFVASTAIISLLLVAGVVATSFFAIRSSYAASRAIDERDRARKIAEVWMETDVYLEQLSIDPYSATGASATSPQMARRAKVAYEKLIQLIEDDEELSAPCAIALYRMALLTAQFEPNERTLELLQRAALKADSASLSGRLSGLIHRQLGYTLTLMQRKSEAQAAHKKALASLQSWSPTNSSDQLRRRFDVAITRNLQSEPALVEKGSASTSQLHSALNDLDRLLKEDREALRSEGLEAEAQYFRNMVKMNLGITDAVNQRAITENPNLQEAVAGFRQLAESAPNFVKYRHRLGRAQYNLGLWHHYAKRFEQSTKTLRQASTNLEMAIRLVPENFELAADLIDTREHLILGLIGLKTTASKVEAIELLSQQQRELENMTAKFPGRSIPTEIDAIEAKLQ